MNLKINIIKYAFIAIVLSLINVARACDICGCAPSMSPLQVLPFFNQNMIGVYNSYTQFKHPATSLNKDGDFLIYDRLVTSTFVYRSAINDKIQALFELPIHANSRVYHAFNEHVLGVGDIAGRLIYNRTLYKKGANISIVRINPRVSMPTGTYMNRGNDKLMLPIGMQPGTGSWSFSLNMDFTMRFNNIGLNVISSLQGFTKNELDYQLGNRSVLGLTASYYKEKNTTTTIPFLGVLHEGIGKDRKYGVIDDATGGGRTAISCGISHYRKRVGVHSQINLPVKQSMAVYQPKLNVNATISVMYFLSSQ